MFGVTEGHDGEDARGAPVGDALAVAGDCQDRPLRRVGAGDVPVVQIDHFHAPGAAAADDRVFALPVVLELEREL